MRDIHNIFYELQFMNSNICNLKLDLDTKFNLLQLENIISNIFPKLVDIFYRSYN